MASEKNLNLKKDTVNEIKNKISGSETVVLFTYQGLTVADVIKLRRKLREVDAEVKIYKNTLVKLALDDLNLDLTEFLEGPNAILFSKNLLEAIKILDSFAKDNKVITIKSGIIKGGIVSVDTIKEYASVPPMETLLSMLASGMMQHVKNLAIGLNMYAEQLEENN